jgi:hypothetical protein
MTRAPFSYLSPFPHRLASGELSAPDVRAGCPGASSLELMDRARELAERLRTSPPHPLGSKNTPSGAGDKGDKPYKPLPVAIPFSGAGDLATIAAIADPDVAWRLEAMRRRVPGVGPIPFLVARCTSSVAGACLSCGDPLAPDQPYRCRPCVEAAILALQGWCPHDSHARRR